MKLIAHRGNINGPEPELENTPFHIMTALEKGYDAEVDVWCLNDQWYLGHDEPKYRIDRVAIEHSNLWCHAKNLQALENMLHCGIRCFWHQQDEFTLTSTGQIWTYPGAPIGANSIIVAKSLEEAESFRDTNVYGVCSDYVGVLK